MKNIIVCFLLSISVLNAQPINYTLQQGFFNEPVSVVTGLDGELMMICEEEIYKEGKSLYLIKLDTNGQQWFSTFAPVSVDPQSEVLPVDDYYITLDVGVECDVISSKILILDTAGNFVNLIYLHDFGGFKPWLPFKLLPMPDTSILVLQPGKEALQISYPSGIYLGSRPFNSFFTGHLTLPDNKWLLYGSSGLYLYDAVSVTPLDSALVNQTVLDAALLPNGQIAAILSDRLVHFDDQLNVLSAQFNTDYLVSGEALELVVADSSVWLWATNAQLAHFNLDLQHDTTYTLDETHARTQHIAAMNDQLYLVQVETDPVGKLSQVLNMQPFHAPVAVHNAGVSAFKLASAVVTDKGPRFYITLDSIYVRVVNSGTEPLHEVTLNGFLGELIDLCPIKFVYQQTYTGLNLFPGEGVEIVIDSISLYNKYILPQTISFCVWTTRPNGLPDSDRTDDKLCNTFPLTIGAFEPQATILPLAIYPNPALEQCTIERPQSATAEPDLLRLFDGRGQLVRELTTTGNVTLNRGSLPAGRYQCLMYSKDGTVFSGTIIWL